MARGRAAWILLVSSFIITAGLRSREMRIEAELIEPRQDLVQQKLQTVELLMVTRAAVGLMHGISTED